MADIQFSSIHCLISKRIREKRAIPQMADWTRQPAKNYSAAIPRLRATVLMETVCSSNPDSAALPPSRLQQRAQQRKLEGLRRDVGPLCLPLLGTSAVIELMLNPDGRIGIDQLGIGTKDAGYRMPRAQAEKLLGDLAAMLDTELTREKPILEGELPLDGSRFEG